MNVPLVTLFSSVSSVFQVLVLELVEEAKAFVSFLQIRCCYCLRQNLMLLESFFFFFNVFNSFFGAEPWKKKVVISSFARLLTFLEHPSCTHLFLLCF